MASDRSFARQICRSFWNNLSNLLNQFQTSQISLFFKLCSACLHLSKTIQSSELILFISQMYISSVLPLASFCFAVSFISLFSPLRRDRFASASKGRHKGIPLIPAAASLNAGAPQSYGPKYGNPGCGSLACEAHLVKRDYIFFFKSAGQRNGSSGKVG